MDERTESLMRIVVGIASGIILSVWQVFIRILAIVNFLIALFAGKRNKEIALLCEIWNTQVYIFLRYMTFVSNKRPFPFTPLEKNFSKFE
tara:strand:- start:214 stop:483 length:270 start_codon:yes stop_codon:yes gene_type:complete